MPMVENHNGKLLWWIMGLLGALITGGGSAWLSSMNTQTRVHGERIAVLESQMQDQKSQLDRIDRKVDKILDLLREK